MNKLEEMLEQSNQCQEKIKSIQSFLNQKKEALKKTSNRNKKRYFN